MKKLTAFLISFFITVITIASIYSSIESDSSLYLDINTTITPIIENAEEPLRDQYIRTLKVTYKDYLDKPIVLQNGDKLYNRCSFQSTITFFSESGKCVIPSYPRMSCEIVAWVNLKETDVAWLKANKVSKIEITNLTTESSQVFQNPDPAFFIGLLNKYNQNTVLK